MSTIRKTMFSIMIIAMTFIAFSSWAIAGSNEPVRGGIFKTNISSDPSTLDVHWTGSDSVWEVGWHMFETILTLDEKWNPIPMLAEYRLDDGGKIITLNLRKNVKFHNGMIMDAEDVEASLKRWLSRSSFAKSAFKNLEAIEIKDSHTVIMKLKEPSSIAVLALAFHDQGSYVMPKEVIEAAGDGEVKEYIGTGPYRFAEWKPDRHIKLERFEDYSALTGGPNGYGGTKHAYADEIRFIPASDSLTQVAGIIAGDFDFALVSTEQESRFKDNPDVSIVPVAAGEMPCMVFNLKQGLMANVNLRKAVLASLNMNDIMIAAAGNPKFYNLHPNWMPRKTIWWNDEGGDVYNKPDPDAVKKLQKEAGYNGEEIRWVTPTTYNYLKNATMVAASQLRKNGFKVKLQLVDWATLGEIRAKPEAYEIFTTGLTMKADPTMIAFMGNGWPGWYDTPRKQELVKRLKSEIDMQTRLATWKEMSALLYQELPAIKFGEINYAAAIRSDVNGQDPGPAIFFWNTWLQK